LSSGSSTTFDRVQNHLCTIFDCGNVAFTAFHEADAVGRRVFAHELNQELVSDHIVLSALVRVLVRASFSTGVDHLHNGTCNLGKPFVKDPRSMAMAMPIERMTEHLRKECEGRRAEQQLRGDAKDKAALSPNTEADHYEDIGSRMGAGNLNANVNRKPE